MATAKSGMENKESGFDSLAVVLIAAAVILLILALSLFLQGGFRHAENLEKEAKIMTPEDTKTRDALAEQEALLQEGLRWIDREQGIVGMPIEDAKALLVEKEARKESES